jgi:2-keto-4-pentenoate hydratase/2-oxohepta-3-ene-1,7-dioic acid hydratase in catechol pathway
MKLCLFDKFRLGILRGDSEVVDVTAVVEAAPHLHPQDLMSHVIANFGSLRARLEEAAKIGTGKALSSVRLRPPLPRPVNIDCMAVNYMEDGTRKEPAPINAFLKSPLSVIGPDDTMQLPDVPASVFEAEAEIAVVIGKPCENVAESEAMSCIFGYTNFIDGSARGLSSGGNSFYQMKSRKTFAPIGPWIVTADEIKDPHNLQIRLWNNGVLKQNFNTSDMAHNIAKSIAFVSSIHPLVPGDILATGTNHRGLHAVQDGDRLDLEVTGLGKLGVFVEDALKRSWPRETRLERQNQGLEPLAPQLSGKFSRAHDRDPRP